MAKIQAFDRVAILDAIEQHLRYMPMKTSKSRIKALRDLRHPQYRLRIGDLRIFYDVAGGSVEIIALLRKEEVEAWLQRWGIRSQ